MSGVQIPPPTYINFQGTLYVVRYELIHRVSLSTTLTANWQEYPKDFRSDKKTDMRADALRVIVSIKDEQATQWLSIKLNHPATAEYLPLYGFHHNEYSFVEPIHHVDMKVNNSAFVFVVLEFYRRIVKPIKSLDTLYKLPTTDLWGGP